MRTVVALALLSCLVTSPFASPQQQTPPVDVKALLSDGEALFKAQRWAEARAKFAQVRGQETDWTKPDVRRAMRLELESCARQDNQDELVKLLAEYRAY